LQAKKIDIPEYSICLIEGESHAQTFKVQCKIKKLDICVLGQGSSRKIAEQSAANLALKAMGKANGP
jgi:ribonuclease-3